MSRPPSTTSAEKSGLQFRSRQSQKEQFRVSFVYLHKENHHEEHKGWPLCTDLQCRTDDG